MRSNAMPPLAADPYRWHSSAAVVCVGQASNPGALNGSCGQVPPGSWTPPELWAILFLPKRNGRGRPDWPAGPRFPSFARQSARSGAASEPLHNLGMTLALEHPPQRQVHHKTGAPTPVRSSRLSFDWIVPGLTEVCFWSALRHRHRGDRRAGRPREVHPSHWPD
jgi:hypothetical protein